MGEENKTVNETGQGEGQEKTYDERQWRGLLGDKQEAIERARSAEAKLAAIETQYSSKIKDLEEKINAKNEDLNLGDPEDVVTNSTLGKTITGLRKELADTKKEMKEMKDYYLGEKKTERETQAEKSVEKAKQRYSEEKVGKGLTWDDVLEGTKRMIKENKMYEQALIYKIGLMDPIIAKRAESYQGSLPVGGVTPKTGLKGTTKPTGYMTQAYVKEQQAKDPGFVRAHLKEIQESQKHWNKDDR